MTCINIFLCVVGIRDEADEKFIGAKYEQIIDTQPT